MPNSLLGGENIDNTYLDPNKVSRFEISDGLTSDTSSIKLNVGGGLNINESGQLDSQWWTKAAEGTIDANNNRMQNVSNPENATDVVNKQTLDAQAGTVQQLLRDIRLYYKFDDDTLNDVFRGYDGTNKNVAFSSTTPSDGNVIGDAAHFQSTSSGGASRFTNGNAFHFADNNFTISFWYYLDNVNAPNHDPLILTSDSNDGNKRFEVLLLKTTNDLKVNFFHDDASDIEKTLITDGPLPHTNTWLHVVITRDGDTSTCYINGSTTDGYSGKSLGTVGTSSITDVSTTSQVGTQDETKNFVGYIDEFGVWDRVLTADEVSQLYNDGSGRQDFLNFSQNVHRKPPIAFVAASDASAVERQVATFLCDDIDDQEEINAAIGTGDKTVMLSSGTFTVSESSSGAGILIQKGTLLRGQGPYSTFVNRKSDAADGTAVINTDTGGNGRYTIQDLTVDGKRLSDASPSQIQLGAYGIGGDMELATIQNVRIQDCLNSGIFATSAGEDTIIDQVKVNNCNGTGIDLNRSKLKNMRVSNCYVKDCGKQDTTDGAGYSLHGEEVTLTNCHDRGSRVSYRVNAKEGGHVLLNNCVGTTGEEEGNGVLVRGDSLNGSLTLANCRFNHESDAAPAINLQDTDNSGESIHLNGTVIKANGDTGLLVGDCTRVTISGGHIDTSGSNSIDVVGDASSEQVCVFGVYTQTDLKVSKTDGNVLITGCYVGGVINDAGDSAINTGNIEGGS
jgi:hypothetical protein